MALKCTGYRKHYPCNDTQKIIWFSIKNFAPGYHTTPFVYSYLRVGKNATLFLELLRVLKKLSILIKKSVIFIRVITKFFTRYPEKGHGISPD